MTPLLRAGLGGLAAALRFLALEQDNAAPWPAPMQIGGANAHVEPRRVRIEWGDTPPVEVLRALFERAFRLSGLGIINLAGAFEPSSPPRLAVAIALQEGLKRTFLQHGKTTRKAGSTRTATEEVDDQVFTFEWQPYGMFVHQEAWEEATHAVLKGSVDLAGWSYPGAAQKHVDFSETKCEYGPAEAVCACFALIGCLSYDVRPGRMGALIIPEPSDLIDFAITRPRLTPARAAEGYVASLGDAALRTQLVLKVDDIARRHPGIAAIHGVLLRTLPWASQQKSRCQTIDLGSISDTTLDLFDKIMRALPSRLRSMPAGEDDVDGGYFVATSALRAFAADNLAIGRRWFAGFSTATTAGKKPRYLHYFRDRDNLGALYPEEKKGLVIMSEDLDEAEAALVRSVHTALRQRYGRIWDETREQPAQTRKNRFASERERWRLAFAGSKTHDQIRGALASLWSLAGANRELKDSWERIVPLLRPRQWQAARDLALVALASYQGSSNQDDGTSEEALAD